MTEQKDKQAGRVKHRQGLADYLALGADRSIEKLHRWYTKNAPKAPCLRSLKGWSTKHGWTAKAAEYDARVAAQIAEKAEEASVEQGVDHVKALTNIADKALQKVIDGLDGESITADNAYQTQALVTSALQAIKGVQLLTGQATERFGYTVKDEAPEWMAEKLKTPAPASPSTAAAASDEIDIPGTATQH